MKTIYTIIILLSLSLSLSAQDTFINSYPYDDLWPSDWTYPNTWNCNVIPAIGGGYLMQAFLNPGNGLWGEPQCMFWKISENGELEWRKQDYEELGYTYITSIVSNGVDRYYAYSIPFVGDLCELIVLDENCNTISTYNYYAEEGIRPMINSMQLLDDGLIMAGRVSGAAFIMKTDFEGHIEWNREGWEILDSTYYVPEFSNVIETSDNGFLACGYRSMNPAKGWLVKFNSEGDTLWTYRRENARYYSILEYSPNIIYSLSIRDDSQRLQLFNSDGILLDEYSYVITVMQGSNRMLKSHDNNILLIYNLMDGELHKISPNGEILWSRRNLVYSMPHTESFIASSDKKFFIDGNSIIYCGTFDGYAEPEFILVKTDLEGNQIININSIISDKNDNLSNYPNPFNPSTNIYYQLPENIKKGLLKIYNVKGEVVNTYKLNDKIGSIVWDGTNSYNDKVSSGIYFYRIESDNYISETRKMILLK